MHKSVLSVDNKNRLETLKEALKKLVARKMAKNVMYAKQNWFDYRDKFRKQLAWLLSRDCARKLVTKLKNNLGIFVASLEEKVEGFFLTILVFILPLIH